MNIDLDMTPLRVTSCLEIGEGWMGSGLTILVQARVLLDLEIVLKRGRMNVNISRMTAIGDIDGAEE